MPQPSWLDWRLIIKAAGYISLVPKKEPRGLQAPSAPWEDKLFPPWKNLLSSVRKALFTFCWSAGENGAWFPLLQASEPTLLLFLLKKSKALQILCCSGGQNQPPTCLEGDLSKKAGDEGGQAECSAQI